jgi:hypothetical protein
MAMPCVLFRKSWILGFVSISVKLAEQSYKRWGIGGKKGKRQEAKAEEAK